MAREMVKAQRNLEICALRDQGMTLQAIADRYGISKETVRQIIVRTRRKVRREMRQEGQDNVQGHD